MLTKKTVTVPNFKAIDHDIYCIDVAHNLKVLTLKLFQTRSLVNSTPKWVSVLDIMPQKRVNLVLLGQDILGMITPSMIKGGCVEI